MRSGIVYTETVVHSAPEAFVKDAPYQLVIVTLDDTGKRLTGRMQAGAARVAIGDPVVLADTTPEGIAWFAPSRSSAPV